MVTPHPVARREEGLRQAAARLREALELERTLSILHSLFPADESLRAWQQASGEADRLRREYADVLLSSRQPSQGDLAGRIGAPEHEF